jgi:CRP-like cAMP-binding protein
MTTADDLAAVPLFQPLNPEELQELANWFDVRTVGEGVSLAGEGASGYSFYVIVEGDVVVTADDVTVATLGPGDFFGEMAIIGDGRRAATVTSTSPAKVLVMFGTDFRQLQQQHPAIAARLEEAMRKRQEELSQLRPKSE